LEDWQQTVLFDHFDQAQELVVLIGKGNGKTTLFAATALWHLLTEPEADCLIAAASRDQASIMYKQAVGFVRRNPRLEEAILIREGTRELRLMGSNSRIKTVASDSNTLDGIAPTLFLCDELHRHKSPDLYTVAMNGLGKRDGKMVTISTAGASLDSPLGKIRDRAHLLNDKTQNDFHLRAASDDKHFVVHEWSVPVGEDVHDISVVKRANPSSFVTEADLKRRLESPSTHERDWLRFACNQWVGNVLDAWIEPGKWALLADSEMRIPEHHEVYVGVDIGLRHDTSAVVVIGQRDDARWMVESTVFTPPDGGELQLADIEQHIMSLHDYYSVRGVVYDRWAFSRSSQELASRGAVTIEMPMTNERMVPACGKLMEAINRAEIVHNGDPVLQSHVEAAAVKSTERGIRVSKGKSGAGPNGKIDALMGLILAFTVATNENPEVSIEWL
jgi:phage terminase large subunit-like protein